MEANNFKRAIKKNKNIKFIIRINKQRDLTKSCLTGIKKASINMY